MHPEDPMRERAISRDDVSIVAEVENLLSRIKNDDQAAIADLLRLIGPVVHSYLKDRFRIQGHDRNDIMSMALYTIWRKRGAYVQRGHPLGWILYIVRCEAVNFARKMFTEPRCPPTPDIASESPSADRHSLVWLVSAWLVRLPEESRRIATSDWDWGSAATTLRALSREFDLSVHQIKRRWLRLRQQLYDLIEYENTSGRAGRAAGRIPARARRTV